MTSVRELKRALDEKGIDYAGVLERPELEKLLQQAEEVEPMRATEAIGRLHHWDADDKYYDTTKSCAAGEHPYYMTTVAAWENLADKKLKVKWLAHTSPERRRTERNRRHHQRLASAPRT